jgi:polysaccharide lyase-like protein
MRKILLLGSLLLLSRPAGATLLWEGDASKGTGVFGNLQAVNGTISVVDDPVWGKVFKIVCNDNGPTKARSEVSRMAGITLKNDGDYFVGWRSKWGPLPTMAGKWQVVAQIHLDGAGSGGKAGPVPFGIQVPGDGMMHFQAEDPSGTPSSMWDHALPLDSWHKYVMHTRMGEDLATGFCEIWFDGVKQTLTNGKDSIPCAMAHPNSGSYWKWGVYRSGAGGDIGQSVHYLHHPMMGTTYEDVSDGAGSGGSDAGSGGAGGGGAGGAPPADAVAGGAAGTDAAAGGAGGAGGSGGVAGSGTGGSAGEGTGGTPPAPTPGTGGGGSPVPPPPPAGGCGCRIGAPPGAGAPILILFCLFCAFVLRRRARRS